MKSCERTCFAIFAVISICIMVSGCANLPLKDGGLEIGKDTTAGISDIGVGSDTGGRGRITRQF